MKNLCIIPARGGSKRIPRKNIKNFCGKPIIAYGIDSALNSGLFEEVIVSTEDDEIAKIAIDFGAKVPFMRSIKTADDYATLSDVIDEVQEQYLTLGNSFDYICCILPTAPFVTSLNLIESFDKLVTSGADSIRPIVKFSYPIQRAVRQDENGRIEMINPEFYRSRSQDLECTYHDAGQFYWIKSSSGMTGKNKLGFEVPESQVQDIDTDEDWNLAVLKYQNAKK